jgi:predicted aspartyl protease
MGAKREGIACMSNFTAKLDEKRTCRYVFKSHLWDTGTDEFGLPVNVLLDTGSFNTIVHKSFAHRYGVVLNKTMKVSIGGFCGDANICVLHKVKVGELVMEKVVALAVHFEGELKEHILLGTNVTNNWKFTVSRRKNKLTVTEEFSDEALSKKYPYRYCFNNKGEVMAFLEFGESE